MNELNAQRAVCERFRASFLESPIDLKVGISEAVREGVRPIHGLRVEQNEDTTGWYIWSGEYSDDDNFFTPLHVGHLQNWEPRLLQYLGLGPGWRFLINPEEGYEDVWYNPNLVEVAN